MRTTSMCLLLGLVILASVARAAGAPPKPAAIEAFGKGVQIYRCTAGDQTFTWMLKAPEATLRDASGQLIGKHFAGPTWQAADGSAVVGEPLNASPSPRAGAIAWIVLRVKSHTGDGQMSAVQYIVRTNTKGGQAPAAGCDSSHVNAEVRVPYSATYLFFRS